MATIIRIQEIVDMIVDQLVDDIQAGQGILGRQHRAIYPLSVQLHELKQYALISRAFASRSQKYLFSTITISEKEVPDLHKLSMTEKTPPTQEPDRNEGHYTPITDLLAIFDRKPHLASYLHTMIISEQFGRLVRRYQPLRALLNVLQDHHNPKKIEVLAGYSLNVSPGCPQPHYYFHEHAAPHVQVLKCGFLEMLPTSFIANQPNLHYLELIYCSRQVNEDVHHTSQRATRVQRPRIRGLALTQSLTVLIGLLGGADSGQPVVDFSFLERLKLGLGSDNDREYEPCVQKLLSIAGPSLKEVAICSSTFGTYSSVRCLDLSTCVNMHFSELVIGVHRLEDSNRFDDFIGTIGTIPTPNSLSTLDIAVHLATNSETRCHPYTSLQWEDMDKALHRVLSTTLSDRVECTLHIQFSREGLDGVDSTYESVVQECEQFVEELKTRRFEHTKPNDRIGFVIYQTLSVDGFA